jgi:hypothetical protein
MEWRKDMTTFENRIGTLFLATDGKTPLNLFEKVYTFLFVENLVYGIVTIVIVLAILIYLFKKGFNSSDKKRDDFNNISKDNGTDREDSLTSIMKKNSNSRNQIPVDETDYSSDLELVAVITAAIMAYMGEDTPEDGLVIRSIRKVNRRNHVNNYSA